MSEKRRNRDKNSSWERKNVKTGRNPHNCQLRTVAILSRRYDENEKCLHAYSAWGVRALQNVWEKLSTSKIKEKRRSRGKKQRLWLGKTSTNPGTVKRYQVSLSICLWYKRIDSLLLCVCLSNRSQKTSKCGKNNQWHTRLGLVCHSNGCGRRWGVLPVIWVCKKAQKQHFDVPVTCHWADTQHDGMYLLNKISLFGLVLKAYIMFMTGFFSTELKNVLVLLPPIMIFFSSVITFIYLFIYLSIYLLQFNGKLPWQVLEQ